MNERRAPIDEGKGWWWCGVVWSYADVVDGNRGGSGHQGKEEEPGRGTGPRRWPVGAVAIGTGGRARAREGRLGMASGRLDPNPSRRGRL